MANKNYVVEIPPGFINAEETRIKNAEFSDVSDSSFTSSSAVGSDVRRANNARFIADKESGDNRKFLGDSTQAFDAGSLLATGIGTGISIYQETRKDSVTADEDAKKFAAVTVSSAIGGAIAGAAISAGGRALIGAIDGPLPIADLIAGFGGAFIGNKIGNWVAEDFDAEILKRTSELEQRNQSFSRQLKGVRLKIT